ncbi:TetR/AcrR family transcriptional regulator [Roseomonas sp. 18066]|uniref:TetR/AcrR family transcriptional regulator n=1 Tax=Roseomonas sp. 18066 TaxID=2681412 RepID=UPI001F477469|nr:TetR/AcrR family transcriptional regulator [Roseomonas sp. 18066]
MKGSGAGVMGGAAAPVLRADARRNRDKLLAEAAQLFAERGVNAALEEIARRAGVGIGTLYRHFPTRDALIATVYQRESEALYAAAEELAARLPADEALARWMHRSLDMMATKRGLGESLKALLRERPELLAASKSGFPAMVERLLGAAKASGRIRGDIELADVLHALNGIYAAPESVEWRARSGRVLDLLVAGMRQGATVG